MKPSSYNTGCIPNKKLLNPNQPQTIGFDSWMEHFIFNKWLQIFFQKSTTTVYINEIRKYPVSSECREGRIVNKRILQPLHQKSKKTSYVNKLKRKFVCFVFANLSGKKSLVTK